MNRQPTEDSERADGATPSAETPPIVCFLTGATAVGKSDVALHLAERHGWEIVSVDSRQIYRRMEIGTAKPTAEERERVRHHLLDLLDPDEVASAGWFREQFLEVEADLRGRHRSALAVGGTGLYWEAATRGLHALPPASPELRAELEAIVERDGLSAVFARLAASDPEGAAGIDRYNRHRVIRACELVELTGKPLAHIYSGTREGERGAAHLGELGPSHLGRHAPTQLGEGNPSRVDGPDPSRNPPYFPTPPVIVLSRPRPELRERIARRCEAMLAGGLLDEIRALLDSGLAPDAPGLRTVGYREFLPHLERSVFLGGEPFLTPPGTLSDALVGAIAAETGVAAELSTTGGTSDGRFIFRICPQVVEFGPLNATIHKIDERVALAEVAPLTAIYQGTLQRFLLGGTS